MQMCPNAPKFTVFLRPESLMLNRTFVGRDFGWKWRRKALARTQYALKGFLIHFFTLPPNRWYKNQSGELLPEGGAGREHAPERKS